MITLTRRQARGLRGVFRRFALGIAHRGPIPPLVFTAEGGQLRARHRYAHTAVEHVIASAWPSGGSVALPLDALADLEGRDDATVALEAVAADRTVARWSDRGIPRFREYPVPPIEGLAAFPEPPGSWSGAPAGLLDALAEADATAAEDDTRYALSCLSLRGTSGVIAATDGRQVLIQRGFAFPWDGEVLVRRSPLFAGRDLPRDQAVSIGKAEAHGVLRVGPWTIWLEAQAGLRFPDVDRILPGPRDAVTRLRLDPGDARFLLDALGRLPGADEPDAPVTVDLDGRIAIRARSSDQDGVTELVLSRSAYTGPPVRLNTNRELLARAIRLGFAEVEVVDADTPLACRDERRVLAWQPLSNGSAIGPSDDATRIESGSQVPGPPILPQDGPPRARIDAIERVHRSRPTERVGETNGHVPAAGPEPTTTGLASLIREAGALHEALADARSRAGRLVVALRKQRRRERLVTATLASLRQLRLQDVAD
jgi:hypothetical protein